MRLLLATVFFIAQLGLAAAAPLTADAANCQFVLGFRTLHDLIPTVVGNCVTNETHNPLNGDGLQQTDRGLLVWRKADNFTAFTDGYRTWVNGPFGVQERLNSQRFPWEKGQLTLDQLRNATYHLPIGFSNTPLAFTLVDGKATLPDLLGTVAFVESPVGYGDLNGDGLTDAAIILAHNGGGTGDFEYLIPVLAQNGQPEQIGSDFLGDRVKVNNLTITPGQVTVDMLVAGPNEPLCCPTQPVSKTFKIALPAGPA